MSDAKFPIVDGEGMPHFPFGDSPEAGPAICYDCQLPWPCPTVVEIESTREVSGV